MLFLLFEKFLADVWNESVHADNVSIAGKSVYLSAGADIRFIGNYLVFGDNLTIIMQNPAADEVTKAYTYKNLSGTPVLTGISKNISERIQKAFINPLNYSYTIEKDGVLYEYTNYLSTEINGERKISYNITKNEVKTESMIFYNFVKRNFTIKIPENTKVKIRADGNEKIINGNYQISGEHIEVSFTGNYNSSKEVLIEFAGNKTKESAFELFTKMPYVGNAVPKNNNNVAVFEFDLAALIIIITVFLIFIFDLIIHPCFCKNENQNENDGDNENEQQNSLNATGWIKII